MIHKRILDAAADQPAASMDEIAAAVPSTNTDLVERVLEEYGDPAKPDPTTTAESDDRDEEKEEHPYPDPETLTEKQREALRVIYEHPDATQRQIGEILDVSAPTVSNRVNAIDHFDWADRYDFAAHVLDTPTTTNQNESMSQNGTIEDASTDHLETRLDSVEERLETLDTEKTNAQGLDDPTLIHKIVHACMESEIISQDEELAILEHFLN